MLREENTELNTLTKPENQLSKLEKEPVTTENQEENATSWLWFTISWVLFIVAIGVYIGIWAISNFAVPILGSYYYEVQHYVSPYIVDSGTAYCNMDATTLGKVSTSIYTTTEVRTAQAVALSLLFSWLMWKLPLSLFILHLAFEQPNRILKYVSWSISLVIMLTVDLLLTVFISTVYQDYMFYCFTAVLAIIISLINNRENLGSAFAAAFLPLFFIAFLYFSYSYFIPALFNVFVNNVSNGYQYLMIYGYPVIDLFIYSLLLILNSKGPKASQNVLSFVQFFILGYFCGITMLASVTEVEFYYLCAYMLFRNFFTNWVMWKWEGVVNNPPALPGWGIVYYLSYAFNFLPIVGLGPLVISKSFTSRQFCRSCLLLYYYPNSSYPYNTSVSTGYNFTLSGYVFWPAALIIWAISTATQKYPTRKPTVFDFFYNMAGIYMFYLGISGGLQLLTLRQVVFK